MKSSSFAAILALALLGGAAAGAVAAWLAAPSHTVPHVVAPGSPATPGQDADLLARVDRLAEENRSLRDRLAELEQRQDPPLRVPVGDFASQEELEELREEVRRALAGRGSVAAEPEILEDEIADALTAIRKRERIDAVRGYHEKRSARLEKDLIKLEEWLELTPYQVDGMRSSLLAQYERESEQARLWEESADPELLVELKRSDGELFHSELAGVLDPEQLETFWTRVVEGGK